MDAGDTSLWSKGLGSFSSNDTPQLGIGRQVPGVGAGARDGCRCQGVGAGTGDGGRCWRWGQVPGGGRCQEGVGARG